MSAFLFEKFLSKKSNQRAAWFIQEIVQSINGKINGPFVAINVKEKDTMASAQLCIMNYELWIELTFPNITD